MKRMTCPLITINMGLSVGMGAVLCSMGTQGRRFALPNARFLMSRVGFEDAFQGQASDIALAVKEVLKENDRVLKELADITQQPFDKVQRDFKRDFYLTAPEAVQYGIIDAVMTPNQAVKVKVYRGRDDRVVGFGHFSESRKVQGPSSGKNAFDEATQKSETKREGPPCTYLIHFYITLNRNLLIVDPL